ncbi:MAG: nucleoside 2-deoxyribosyltransferase [Paenisporosarcina sp.]
MKFYVASGFQNKEQVRFVAAELLKYGWYHTYDWTQNNRANSLEDLQRIGILEKDAVAQSDLVIVLLPGGKGCHIELGMAIAGNKKIFLYSPDQMVMNMETTSTFYHLPEVDIYLGTIEELVEKVKATFVKF